MDNRKVAVVAALFLIGAAIAVSGVYEQSETAVFVDESGKELAEITYEEAVTDEERRKGLMDREELNENHGMIFVYEDEAPRSFWMKNTLIPLDIIFLDSNKTVINVEKAYPEPGVADDNLKRYRSEEPAQYVIEVNQNFTDRNGIEAGDRAKFSLK